MNNHLLRDVSRRASEKHGSHLINIIQKELLHYDILYCLDKEGLLADLVFQGGTALRLCYNAPRYSEDLDFAGGNDVSLETFRPLKKRIESYIRDRYRLHVRVKEPKTRILHSGQTDVGISRWWVSVITEPTRRDLPHLRVKLEVANVPALMPTVQRLYTNYDALPDGYEDLLIPVESTEEILADKLISLPTSKSVRYRDIWDIAWLQRKNVQLNTKFVEQKVRDYGITNYDALLSQLIDRLPSLVTGVEFAQQMSLLLPEDRYQETFGNTRFTPYTLNSIQSLFSNVRETVRTMPSVSKPDLSGQTLGLEQRN